MDKIVKKMFGDDLIRALNQMIDEFVELDFDENDIYKSIKGINESVRTCLYLLAEERGLTNMAFKIEKINKRLKIEIVENFKNAFDKGETDKFFKKLNKTDKMDLLHDMELDIDPKNAYKLSKIKQVYRNTINKSIMEDQAKENKDGYDTFVKYEKEDSKKNNKSNKNDKKTT